MALKIIIDSEDYITCREKSTGRQGIYNVKKGVFNPFPRKMELSCNLSQDVDCTVWVKTYKLDTGNKQLKEMK